ncbi:hypothetical protein U5903_10645 [Cereibacter johrii]|uniref:hypothetical protein n=1 Tax=Cereibacter johrii TaxID=445629 RepID=UPI002B25F763|nr:hypothetical protein [Cereibacter johrii]MEA5161230.1 hypothetical protein [Cereibacter johrii]
MANLDPTILEEIARFLGAEAAEDKEEMFSKWFRDSLALWVGTSEASSFAPFDDRFRNQDASYDNFHSFIEREFGGVQRIGKLPIRSLVAREYSRTLSTLPSDISPFLIASDDSIHVSRAAEDVFRSFHSLDRAGALDWFLRYLATWTRTGHERDVSGEALPIVLFEAAQGMAATDDLGTAMAAAMFDWCEANPREPGLWRILPNVLNLRLQSISRIQPKRQATKQAVEVLGRFADPESGELKLADILGGQLGLLPDPMERWADLREGLSRSLHGIELKMGQATWVSRVRTPLYSALPWTSATDAPARSDEGSRGMLENLRNKSRVPNLGSIRPQNRREAFA